MTYRTQFEFNSASIAINASKSLKSNPENFPEVINICFKKSDFESYIILTTETPESLISTKEKLLLLEKEYYKNKSTQYCYFEKHSKCTKTDCPYLHINKSKPNIPESNNHKSNNHKSNNHKPNIPESNNPESNNHKSNETTKKDEKDETYKQHIPCRYYFINKNCLNENCPYSHDDNLSESILKYYLKTPECKFNEKCTRPNCPYLHIPD